MKDGDDELDLEQAQSMMGGMKVDENEGDASIFWCGLSFFACNGYPGRCLDCVWEVLELVIVHQALNSIAQNM